MRASDAFTPEQGAKKLGFGLCGYDFDDDQFIHEKRVRLYLAEGERVRRLCL
jgi:hypothetical protein